MSLLLGLSVTLFLADAVCEWRGGASARRGLERCYADLEKSGSWCWLSRFEEGRSNLFAQVGSATHSGIPEEAIQNWL